LRGASHNRIAEIGFFGVPAEVRHSDEMRWLQVFCSAQWSVAWQQVSELETGKRE
jgi:hypothetical protein